MQFCGMWFILHSLKWNLRFIVHISILLYTLFAVSYFLIMIQSTFMTTCYRWSSWCRMQPNLPVNEFSEHPFKPDWAQQTSIRFSSDHMKSGRIRSSLCSNKLTTDDGGMGLHNKITKIRDKSLHATDFTVIRYVCMWRHDINKSSINCVHSCDWQIN